MILQCSFNVRNTGSLILKRKPKATLAITFKRFEEYSPATPINQRVAGNLARGGNDLRLVDQAEPALDGPGAYSLPNLYNVSLLKICIRWLPGGSRGPQQVHPSFHIQRGPYSRQR